VALLLRDVYSPVHRVYRDAILNPSALPTTIPAGTRIFKTTSFLYPGSEPYVTLNSRARMEYQGTATHKDGSLVFGYNYEHQSGDISKMDVSRDKHGLFAMEQYSIGRRIFLTGGLRVEHSSAFGTKVAPRGAASFQLFGEKGIFSSTFFRVSAGQGITEPSLIQNFSKEAYYVGNPNLKPEKTNSYEAGVVQEWFGRRLHTEVSAFWNSFHDLIVFVSLPPPVWGSWDNIDSSWAKGFEFSGRARLAKYVTLNGAYTLLYTRIVNSNSPASLTTGIGQELLRRPKNSGSLSLTVAPRRWWFIAGACLVGERQDSDFLGTTRNPGYQNVFAGGGYRVNNHVTPFLRVDNLLNSRYEEALGYSSLSRSVRGGLKIAW
jgi:outer membrane receptor protein involved in Fe transport